MNIIFYRLNVQNITINYFTYNPLFDLIKSIDFRVRIPYSESCIIRNSEFLREQSVH